MLADSSIHCILKNKKFVALFIDLKIKLQVTLHTTMHFVVEALIIPVKSWRAVWYTSLKCLSKKIVTPNNLFRFLSALEQWRKHFQQTLPYFSPFECFFNPQTYHQLWIDRFDVYLHQSARLFNKKNSNLILQRDNWSK